MLDDALALIAAGKIEIDIRPFAAFFGQKALEQQLHRHRVDGSDPERIADGAVGGRAAALHENVLGPAKFDDVPDDQEIAREIEFFDEREFFFDLTVGAAAQAGGEGIRIITIVLAFSHALAQERVHGFAGRNGIFGELVAEVGERELEAIGKFTGVGDGFGKVAEDARHLPCVFQIALGIDGEQAAGFVDGYFLADAGKDIQRFSGSGVAWFIEKSQDIGTPENLPLFPVVIPDDDAIYVLP